MNFLIRVGLLWVFAALCVLVLFTLGSELIILRSRAFLVGVVLPLAVLTVWAARKAADERRGK